MPINESKQKNIATTSASTMHTTTPITVTISSVENRFKISFCDQTENPERWPRLFRLGLNYSKMADHYLADLDLTPLSQVLHA